jgi:hypothetical protein
MSFVRDNERSKGAKTQFTSLKWQYPRAQDRGRLPKMLERKEQNHGTQCRADSSFAGEDWPVGWRSPRILNRLTDGCRLLHLRHFFERRNQKDAQLFVAWLALRCTTSSDRANEVSESSPTSRKP